VTFPPGTRFEGRPPTEVIGVLQDILAELRLGGAEGVRRTGDQMIQNYSIGQIDAAAALDNFHVPLGSTHRLQFLEVPHFLTQLLVRLNDPGQPTIDVLNAGKVIESDTPIARMFVTTNDGVAGQVIRYTEGNLKVLLPARDISTPPIREVRGVVAKPNPDFTAAVDAAGLVQNTIFGIDFGASSSGNTTLLENMAANVAYRASGHIISRKPSTGAARDFLQLQVRDTSGSAIRYRFLGTHVPESGSLIVPFDSGWFCLPESGFIQFAYTLGIAANNQEGNMIVEAHPLI